MAKKMLIDAGHPEETRVVVLAGNRVEEFDFEAANKKQLKGNIYLAKVTRVEPSLQAAFVEYGGNRHGFLAFSEIHPDYYQIPVADRQALLEEEAAAEREADLEEDEEAENGGEESSETAFEEEAVETESDWSDRSLGNTAADLAAGPLSHGKETSASPPDERDEDDRADAPALLASNAAEAMAKSPDDEALAEEAADPAAFAAGESVPAKAGSETEDPATAISDDESEDNVPDSASSGEIVDIATPASTPEEVGAQDAMEEVARKRRRMMRRYKIQEVIKRRQIILVQVVKEERGNKGAALTTYLSLAGRYCVLMPNTDRGGGISRKITQANDRKRLKEIANELQVPHGMGLIIRTAGANRTKAELKRDYEYLLRLWESVRELTLQSVAPKLVYEEGNLVKRSIRDLYGRDIDTVLVEGDEAYKEAKAFMRMLTPSHAKNVQPYKDRIPLFQRYQVESQLDALYSPTVELRSGGYIVIDPTEALVSIDVNSGRATKEHSIEETALKTNLEAAEEIARQLRLRDLAGLIVIDFIDMEENRNNRQVERKIKECLKHDRARIQVGRISAFGLLEMSRQRLRSSVLEGQTLVCPHCEGVGRVPSIENTVLRILRAVEEEGIRGRMNGVQVTATSEVALYLLNHKRWMLQEIEARYDMPCFIEADAELVEGQYRIERAPEALVEMRIAASRQNQATDAIAAGGTASPDQIDLMDETEWEAEDEAEQEITDAGADVPEPLAAEADGSGRGRRRRKRRPSSKSISEQASAEASEDQPSGENDDAEDAADQSLASSEDGDATGKRKRRRGRRGGRRNRRQQDKPSSVASELEGQPAESEPYEAAEAPETKEEESDEADKAISVRRIEIQTAANASAGETENGEISESSLTTEEGPSLERSNETQPALEPVLTEEARPAMSAKAEQPHGLDVEAEPEHLSEPPKRGWWQRRIFG